MTLPAVRPDAAPTLSDAADFALPPPRRRWRGRPRANAVPVGAWPDLVGRLLSLRGLTDEAAAIAFLGPPDAQPDPYALPALDIAIERLLQAVQRHEIVAVYGDFDVDGVTSAAQLVEALSALGGAPIPYIPDRFAEGYGLNIPAIEALRRDGATLLVTADCGTSSVEEVASARALGMDVIILDHHTVPPVLPDANALVNPKLTGAAPGGLLELATAGLAFHVVAALHAAAGRAFEPEASLDLAALGTVCDMAPLADENRRLLRTGLPALARTSRPGLQALMDVSRIDAASVSAEDIGYKLGPRLNAAGRIAHARLALELLMTRDEERGRELAYQLDALNRERQEKTAQAVSLAAHLVEQDAAVPALLMIGHPDFSSGIVGLIASKLVDLYGRPAVVYELGAETSRASCRSIDEFHITDALRAHADLFERFGGHRAAAGFTVRNDRIDEARSALVAEAERELAGRELAPVLEIDCNLPLRALRGEEIRWLARIGPFGIGNPQPMFLARGVTVVDARTVGGGDRHLKLRLRDGGATWPAIAFDFGAFGAEAGDRVDIVYCVQAEARLDSPLEIRVEDMRRS
ncbi:MAG: single-stranded-DNA-specific exonuclease RecJ [Chloroflexota bacterium]|nr:single-stranded-DNA-specific exonuclease RecJ [Chloroflexota bacterium]